MAFKKKVLLTHQIVTSHPPPSNLKCAILKCIRTGLCIEITPKYSEDAWKSNEFDSQMKEFERKKNNSNPFILRSLNCIMNDFEEKCVRYYYLEGSYNSNFSLFSFLIFFYRWFALNKKVKKWKFKDCWIIDATKTWLNSKLRWKFLKNCKKSIYQQIQKSMIKS